MLAYTSSSLIKHWKSSISYCSRWKVGYSVPYILRWLDLHWRTVQSSSKECDSNKDTSTRLLQQRQENHALLALFHQQVKTWNISSSFIEPNFFELLFRQECCSNGEVANIGMCWWRWSVQKSTYKKGNWNKPFVKLLCKYCKRPTCNKKPSEFYSTQLLFCAASKCECLFWRGFTG